MTNEFQGQESHSAEYFGETRDYWWNADFLRLMSQRWRLEAVKELLDVGCGVGHWGALLAGVMPAETRVTGVDRDPVWIEKASERAKARGHGGRFAYRVAEVERLPFPDDTFDLTTCQTVLIHVRDPSAAIAEMIRVTKPGGLVAVAEPNNLAGALLLDSVSVTAPIDEVVELVRFQLTCERGKSALGEGNNSVGDLIPGIFAARGLTSIEVHLNDKAGAMFPPYATDEQRAFVEEAREHADRSFWIWSEEDTRRFFVAGGGNAGAFGAHWTRAMTARASGTRSLSEGTYSGGGGAICYLVAGRKPAR
jgi:SAM-dependent methyltransferase